MPMPNVSAVTITVNTFHLRPISAMDPTTHNEAMPTGNSTMMAGMMRRVSRKRTRNETMSEMAVLSIWVVVNPFSTVSSITKSPVTWRTAWSLSWYFSVPESSVEPKMAMKLSTTRLDSTEVDASTRISWRR